MSGVCFAWTTAFLAASFLSSSFAFGQLMEAEPNQTCDQARGPLLTFEDLPLDIYGELSPGPFGEMSGDVDFYYFEAPSDMSLSVLLQMDDAPSVPSFDFWNLGLFDVDCHAIPINTRLTRYPDGFWKRMDITPVSDGEVRFYIGVTGYPDSSFDGSHESRGPYTLRLMVTPKPVRAITGRVVDAFGGQAVTDVQVRLFYCSTKDCQWEVTQEYFYSSMFYFEGSPGGYALDAGTYLIRIRALDYEPAELGPFEVEPGELIDLGDVLLQPVALVFENIVTCGDPSAEGGYCVYSFDVRNRSDRPIDALWWNLVTAFPYTWDQWDQQSVFQPQRSNRVSIEPFSTVTLQSRFRIPPGLQAGTYVAVDAYISDRSAGHFKVLKMQHLFGVTKTGTTVEVAEPRDAMETKRLFPLDIRH